MKAVTTTGIGITVFLLASLAIATPAQAEAIVSTGSSSASPTATPVPTASPTQSVGPSLAAGWTAELVTPSNAAQFHDLDAKLASTVAASTIRPNYDPVTIGFCNGGFGDTVVNSWNTKKFEVVDLKCGDSSSGYVHIRKYHQNSSATKTGYQPYVDKAKYPGSWDDLLNIGLSYSLQTPASGFPEQQGTTQKWCYAQEVGLKKDGKPVVSFWNNTIVSGNNKLVITSYPSDYYADCTND